MIESIGRSVALAALLLVGTALVAHVLADENCMTCGDDWHAANEAKTSALESFNLATLMKSVAVDLQDAIEYCHDNHGGATSESQYEGYMLIAELRIEQGDLYKSAADTTSAEGEAHMATGNTFCPTDCISAADQYAQAESHFDGASTSYSNAWDQYLEAVWAYDTAIGLLVGADPCDCMFEW